MKLTRRGFLGASGVSLASLAAGWTQPRPSMLATAAAATSPRMGGTLVLAIGGFGGSLDPGTNNDGDAWEKLLHIYDPLVRLKAVPPNSSVPYGVIEPGLAASWKISDDGLTYTFNLRRGVKFHDGTPLNAEAVVLNIDRTLNENNPYYFKGRMVNAQFLYGTVASYRAVDSNTVEVRLKHRYAPFFATIANPTAGIASPAALKKYGQDLATHPVGTGAFRFVDQVPEDRTTLERNPNWWGGKAYLDRLIFRTVTEGTTRLAMLQKGEADFIEAITTDDIPQIKGHANLQLLTAPGGTSDVWLATQTKPFTDVRVRQALNYAVNRKEINDDVYHGLGKVSSAPMPSWMADFDPTLRAYPFDPDKAKQLLAEAGYPNGFETRLMTYTKTELYTPMGGVKFAEIIQQYLSRVNVKVTIEPEEAAVWNSRRLKGDFQMAVGGWFGINMDPDGWFYPVFYSKNTPGRNSSKLNDPKLDQMMLAAQQEVDPRKRHADYVAIQKYLWDIVPWIYVNEPDGFNGANKRVNDIRLYTPFSRSCLTTWVSG